MSALPATDRPGSTRRDRVQTFGLHSYRRWKLWIEPERLLMLRVTRGWLGRCQPGSVVLEVGAGSGFMRGIVEHEIPAVRYIASDIAPTENTSVVLDACSLPISDDSVDVVLAVEVLEHVSRPEQLIAEAARVLRPGGQLILTVPFMFGVHDFQDFYRFTPRGLEQFLARQGLTLTHTRLRGGTFVASTGLVRTLILNSIVGSPVDWRARGSEKKARWLVATAVLSPWALVTLAAYALDSALDRHSASPPGYFFLCTKASPA
jgi:SAM-dependent methyltransferase